MDDPCGVDHDSDVVARLRMADVSRHRLEQIAGS
jgi:hypothetical protein